jgi:hypothetical protein
MKSALALSMFLVAIGHVPGSDRPCPQVEVLVQGMAVPTYHHSGTTYVEAYKGREYAIRVTNPIGSRVAVALSVDGLNTIDARLTDARTARKWVLGPYESIVISGWQTNESQARRFFFTTEDRSYGAWMGQTADLGIIGAVFFREKARLVQSPNPAPEASSRSEAPRGSADSERHQRNEAGADTKDYAATGIGRRVDHEVQWVQMELEDHPFTAVNLRYEYRSALVRLGVILPDPAADPLIRRGNARGFRDAVYCPEP